MRKLYFDIDGTVLMLDSELPKAALAGGGFERAVRRAGFDKLVCVGNFTGVVHLVRERIESYDGLGVIFALCAGVFEDEAWFRATVELTADPESRATDVDLESDWWYVDDLAEHYFQLAGKEDLFRSHVGRRILAPSPRGEGRDVLDWVAAMGSA